MVLYSCFLIVNCFLVHAEVCKVSEATLPILGCVWLRCEAHQPVLIDIDGQWLKTGHQHVDSQIVLEASNQMRPHNVLINNIGALLRQAAVLAEDFDTTTACTGRRFQDPEHLTLSLLAFLLKQAYIVR